MNFFLTLEPLVSRYTNLYNLCNHRMRFLTNYKNYSTLSYLNLIPDSEKTNHFSNLDLNECMSSVKCKSFSQYVDNYRNIVCNLNYKIKKVESYFKSSYDTSDELEYDIIGSYAYYLRPFEGSLCLYRTLMSGCKRGGYDLESYILRNGKILLNFSEIERHGIKNVKKLRVSPNGSLISVLYDPNYNDDQKVIFYSISKGRFFKPILDGIGEVYLMPHTQNGRYTRLYYTHLNANKRSCKLFTSLIHNGSGRICSKLLIYDEPVNFVSLFKSKSGRALFMATTSYNKVFSTLIINQKGKLYVIPNRRNTKTLLEYRNHIIYRIYSSTVSRISTISTRELKPYKLRYKDSIMDNKDNSEGIKVDYTISDIDMFNKGLVLYMFRPPSTPKLAIIPFGKGLCKRGSHEIKYIEVPGQVGVIEPSSNMNYGYNRVKFSINSPGSPEVRMEVCLDTHEVTVDGEMGNSTSSFVLEVPSSDGSCKIPVTVVTKERGVAEVGEIVRRKCMLYVYGFYGENLKVCNHIEHYPLLEMGYIISFAHVRGGGELGEEWHKMGSKKNKHNSFYDLVDVIKYLVGKNITSADRLAVNVSSASGILGGCLYNMRPEMCSVIIFKLPYLDLLATVTDGSNPLVELEYEEFGNTHKEAEALEKVYAIDPCNNLRNSEVRRPVLIINCDQNDIRAPWYHTARFLTLLRQNHENENIFVKISNYGHDGHPPEEYVTRTCSEYISIIEHFINKNTQNEY